MKFYTVDQAAELLQCSDHTVRQMISAGKLYAIRLGATDRGDIRIGEAALHALAIGETRSDVSVSGGGDCNARVTTPVSPPIPLPRHSKRFVR